MPNEQPSGAEPRYVGVMTMTASSHPPFGSRDFYRRLCAAGRLLGLTVYVFTPEALLAAEDTVPGYAYDGSADRWVRQDYPLPHIVYDRCFFRSAFEQALYRNARQRLQAERGCRLLGAGLKGKWDVHRLLQLDGRFDRWLPATQPLGSLRTLAAWLQNHREAILKPQGGSQGRGVLHVRRGTEKAAEAPFSVHGRDARNRPVSRGFGSAGGLWPWLRGFVGRRPYLLQQYLTLQGEDGGAFDVRALVQKNGSGRWQLTGTAVRQGQGGSLTSNLHGGGTAAAAGAFLAGRFGPARAAELQRELAELALQLPEALEAGGGRLAELGIDFGVDRDGRLWLLEVNSKPGRQVFTYLHDPEAQEAALTMPLHYAAFLLKQAPPLRELDGAVSRQSRPLVYTAGVSGSGGLVPYRG